MDADRSVEKPIPRIRNSVNLRPYNTLGTEAVAAKFVTVSSEDDIRVLFNHGMLKRGSVLVLGSGSNMLFKGHVEPLLLKMEIGGIDIVEENDQSVKVRSGAGVVWHDLVEFAVKKGLGGIENLALIPGTVGAAPVQNIGAYGVELDQVFDSLRVFDLDDGSFYTMNREECRFSYRDSVFKRAGNGRFIVVSVTLTLGKPPHQIHSSYTDLANWLHENQIPVPDIEDIYRGVIDIRMSKLPDPALLGNAGSFFKNPVIEKEKLEGLLRRFPDLPSYPAGPAENTTVKIPAAWLIEKAGWKGRRIGDAGTYENQALVIVNYGHATGDEIWALAQMIRTTVLEIFDIELVPEVNTVGSA